jgi:hypothetical protein
MENIKINEIIFDKETSIWKTKLNLKKFKKEFIDICYKEIKFNKKAKFDGYTYKFDAKYKLGNNKWESSNSKEILIKRELDVVIQNSINITENIYTLSCNNWNIINFNSWINRVRSIAPVQDTFYMENRNDQFHTHTEISKKNGGFYPNYTWIYYIEMPDVIRENTDDALLYFKSKNGIEYSILPEEDDLIIIPGDIPHLPMNAPKATNDRIVLAGNVGFEMIKIKKTLF